MALIRSRRLEELFGASLDDLSAEHVESLVTSGATEAFDLDFKEALYGKTDQDRRDLAGDVAALANTAGGAIVIGVQEDDQSRAVAAPGVVLSDGEVSRIRQVVAALVSPLPVFDIRRVEQSSHSGGETLGFVVIVVARSTGAPHAVLVNSALRYPKRNGATTRYLSEPEVATAYRERFRGAEIQSDRLEDVDKGVWRQLSDSHAWIIVSVVPDAPGDLGINVSAFERFRNDVLTRPVGPLAQSTFSRANVGPRKLIAAGNHQLSDREKYILLELHADGACALAIALPDIVDRRFQGVETLSGTWMVSDEAICAAILTGLLRCGQESRDRAGASGLALVRVRLACPLATTVQVGETRSGFPDSISEVQVEVTAEAEISVALDDIAATTPSLVAAAALVGDELIQAFGVAELGQVTHSGLLRRRYWNRGWLQRLEPWAADSQLEFTDDGLT